VMSTPLCLTSVSTFQAHSLPSSKKLATLRAVP
jgi:hypothetical protein